MVDMYCNSKSMAYMEKNEYIMISVIFLDHNYFKVPTVLTPKNYVLSSITVRSKHKRLKTLIFMRQNIAWKHVQGKPLFQAINNKTLTIIMKQF